MAVVAELLRAERGPDLMLASLARAGTPVGILLRRWASRQGLHWPHVAVSIVRGKGIDEVALRWAAAHHDPASVVFVDGWTGKGAIVRELSAALTALDAGFSDDLAVLADPGRCVRTFGTREDYLVPSACLNSTVSGLVSRTVLNDRLIAPGQFHGAKFYADLPPSTCPGGSSTRSPPASRTWPTRCPPRSRPSAPATGRRRSRGGPRWNASASTTASGT